MSIRWRYLAEMLIGGILVDAAIYASFFLWPTLRRRLGIFDGNRSTFVRVLFFPEEKDPCRRHYEQQVLDGDSGCADGTLCPFSHEAPLLDEMFRLFRRVEHSLDVCVYSISSYELCSAILAIHARGVRVRIIVDGNFCDDSKSKIGRCRAKGKGRAQNLFVAYEREHGFYLGIIFTHVPGIPVRSNMSSGLMHHKFLILDRRILMNGSLNWTWQAVSMNHENVMVTDCRAMVEQYVKEFERLWIKFDPINYR